MTRFGQSEPSIKRHLHCVMLSFTMEASLTAVVVVDSRSSLLTTVKPLKRGAQNKNEDAIKFRKMQSEPF